MERREFLRKSALAVAAASVAPAVLSAAEKPYDIAPAGDSPELVPTISSDTVKDGVRTIVAVPSLKVCSKQIDIQINTKDNTIKSCRFTRGCPGNALGLCNLIVGMKTSEVITRLGGTPCASRGTSCPDQLARVLKMLK